MKAFKLLSLLIVVALTSCNEFFEDDITDQEVEILSPVDSLVTTKTTLTFWWNPLYDATHYKLQVVSPSFDTILSNPLDTTITENKFVFTLNPGRYHWRLKAMNSSSETSWTTRSLTIEDIPDLSEQEVLLKSPANQRAFAYTKVLFEWYMLPNATNYGLIVKRESWEGQQAVPMQFTDKDTISVVLPEGIYVWGVRGYNESSQSNVQTSTFFVDLTPPEKPLLTTPENSITITAVPIQMEWQHPSTDLTPVYDSIFIAKDNTFSADSKLVFEKLQTTSYSFTTTYRGIVYWKVKTIDKAGNESEFSEVYNFTLE